MSSAFPVLTTSRLILRLAEPADDAAMQEILSDHENMKYLADFQKDWTASEVEERRLRWHRQYVENGVPSWHVINRVTKDCIGSAGYTMSGDSDGMRTGWHGIILKRACSGHGYGSECHQATLEYGFSTLQLQQVISCTDAENAPMRALLEKFGFELRQIGDDYSPSSCVYVLRADRWLERSQQC